MEGLFYAELLEFLKRDVEKRCEEGVDPKCDPHIQSFLKGLSAESSDQPLPFAEIIDHYQQLFAVQGPAIHIEKILMEAFPIKDFVDLGLARFYPRMYRGLPRLYHRNYPSQSHIKKNFTHLPSLKKLAVSKALFSLYEHAPVRGKVTLFTWVLGDGLGDYTAATEVLYMLQERWPDLEVRFVGLVQRDTAADLPCPEGSFIIPYERECSLNVLTPEVLALLRNSDLILQMPTLFPHTLQLIETLQSMEVEKPMPKVELVGEYGFLESSWFHPKSGAYCMGLHFLEKGILIRKACQARWEDVKNERLMQWILPQNRFYLAYLTSPIGGAIYLHALLKSLENDSQGIDLCVPDLDWFVQFVKRQNQAGRPILEWEMGIESIEVYYEDRTYAISLAPEGKKVRLLCPGRIAQNDFRALLALSGEWVAVRGDQSFSEVISQGKTFFYDGRDHACYFMKDLVALAENRVGDFPSTLTCIRGMNQGFRYNMPIQEGEWVDETFFQECEEWTSIALSIGLALQDPDTAAGYLKLSKIIVEECAANSFLCHLVQRALCHLQNPSLQRIEMEELSLFTSNAKTFTQLIQSLMIVKKTNF